MILPKGFLQNSVPFFAQGGSAGENDTRARAHFFGGRDILMSVISLIHILDTQRWNIIHHNLLHSFVIFFSRPTKRPTDRPSKEMANNVLFVFVSDKMGRHSSLTLKLRIHHQYPICFLPVPSIKKSKVRVGVPNYSVIKSFRKWYFKGSEWLSKNVA